MNAAAIAACGPAAACSRDSSGTPAVARNHPWPVCCVHLKNKITSATSWADLTIHAAFRSSVLQHVEGSEGHGDPE